MLAPGSPRVPLSPTQRAGCRHPEKSQNGTSTNSKNPVPVSVSVLVLVLVSDGSVGETRTATRTRTRARTGFPKFRRLERAQERLQIALFPVGEVDVEAVLVEVDHLADVLGAPVMEVR